MTAYGTSELPVIACNDDRRRAARHRRPAGAGRRRADRVTRDRRAARRPSAGRDPGALGFGDGRLPPGRATTAEAFADGWYRTGDVGYLDADGWLRITDRAKEMIKVRGFQVAPAEIEAVLHGHPAVADCAVFGVPDAADGEAVVAAVTTNAAGRPPTSSSRSSATRLASYKRPSRRRVRARNPAPAIGQGVAPSV